MTERELFDSLIPQVAEIIVECKKMSLQDYVCLKSETLAAVPDAAKAFMFKIMLVIDDNVLEHLKEKEEKSEEA